MPAARGELGQVYARHPAAGMGAAALRRWAISATRRPARVVPFGRSGGAAMSGRRLTVAEQALVEMTQSKLAVKFGVS